MRGAVWLVGGLVWVAAGCGDAKKVSDSTPGLTTEDLEDVKEMIQTYQKTHKQPPAKAADIRGMEPAYPQAVAAINRGDCVYLWGAWLEKGSQAVLAHGKDASQSGSPVLLQDGTVKVMSAAEFASAPKAKK
jgi:hypothetical protein